MDFHSYETIIILFIYLFFIYMRNYYNMDAERRSGCGDLPGGVTPTKLRRSSVLLIGVLILLVLIVIVLLFGLLVLLGLVVWLRRLMVQPQVEGDVGDVIMHGRSQPPALLGQLGVVCNGVLCLLLCAKGSDLTQEVGDAPHDRVLIVEAC